MNRKASPHRRWRATWSVFLGVAETILVPLSDPCPLQGGFYVSGSFNVRPFLTQAPHSSGSGGGSLRFHVCASDQGRQRDQPSDQLSGEIVGFDGNGRD